MLDAQSLFVPVGSTARLHLRHFPGSGSPAFLVHGAIENGRIFYSQTGKGLAPYLQQLGYDVYVLDQRGRGLSVPAADRSADYGQLESITEDLPAVAAFIQARRPGHQQVWISHSWGGVLQMSCLARHPQLIEQVAALVHFAVKRSISVWSLERFTKLELGWKRLFPLVSAVLGYLPAHRLGVGSDVETRQSLRASNRWVRPGHWVDPDDGFDYAAAAGSVEFPPSFWLTGAQDRLLGHPQDVRVFMRECQLNEDSFIVVGRAQGALHDYDHINLMTHPAARQDHFPRVAAWLSAIEGVSVSEDSFTVEGATT